MKIMCVVGAAILSAGIAVSGAKATTYTFDFTGPDFSSPYGSPASFVLSTPFNPGHQGYTGGPDQLWGYTSITGIGGWPDFFPGGEQIDLEATSLPTPYGNLFLTASTPFFGLTYVSTVNGPSTPFDLSFPGFTHNAGIETVSLVNDGWGSPGYGHTDSLTITAVPEPATWGLMLLGFAALGFAGYRRATNPIASHFA